MCWFETITTVHSEGLHPLVNSLHHTAEHHRLLQVNQSKTPAMTSCPRRLQYLTRTQLKWAQRCVLGCWLCWCSHSPVLAKAVCSPSNKGTASARLLVVLSLIDWWTSTCPLTQYSPFRVFLRSPPLSFLRHTVAFTKAVRGNRVGSTEPVVCTFAIASCVVWVTATEILCRHYLVKQMLNDLQQSWLVRFSAPCFYIKSSPCSVTHFHR